MIYTREVVGLKEEKEQLDAKKEKKAKRSGSEIEESERSSVDIDNTLDPDGAPARRIVFLGYIKASCSYKIWKGCKGQLPGPVGYQVLRGDRGVERLIARRRV